MRKKVEIKKKNILVIDDDELRKRLIESSLKHDYELTTKSDGEEAMTHLLNDCIPDLILLDMELPKMNGRVFIKQLHTSPKLNKIPIIVTSGDNNKTIIRSIMKQGIKDYLLKPFDEHKLKESVKKVIEAEESNY